MLIKPFLNWRTILFCNYVAVVSKEMFLKMVLNVLSHSEYHFIIHLCMMRMQNILFFSYSLDKKDKSEQAVLFVSFVRYIIIWLNTSCVLLIV